MSGMPIVEVAIGLVFAYMLLSMLCTFINEWIAKLLSLRSKNLKSGVNQLLADESMVTSFFNHHLIRGSASKENGPSYIASETFARVVIDIIDSKSDGCAKIARNSNDIKNALDKARLPSDLERALIGLIDDGNATINDLRGNLQSWFDSSMARISGWYKRKIQLISLGIAVLLAFGLNVDSIQISQSLWQNPVLRAQIADQAAAATAICKDKAPEDCPILKMSEDTVKELKMFPIAWQSEGGLFDPQHWSMLKVIGCLITALAISLGAPFWFDVLDKLNSIRSSGAKPRTADEQK